MHPLLRAVRVTWDRHAAYARALASDVPAPDFAAQPIPGRTLNHPAWILSHLCVYPPVCAAMLRGEPFEDPASHRFGPRSSVEGAGAYETRDTLVERFLRLHAEGSEALALADPAVLDRPTPLERWRATHPFTGDMLVTLMVKHEAGHLGQFSAWRRAMALPRVPM